MIAKFKVVFYCTAILYDIACWTLKEQTTTEKGSSSSRTICYRRRKQQ